MFSMMQMVKTSNKNFWQKSQMFACWFAKHPYTKTLSETEFNQTLNFHGSLILKCLLNSVKAT